MGKNKSEDKYEDIPIEEFEKDDQDIREEFLKKFSKGKSKDDKIEKSEENTIFNKIKKWL